MAQGTTSPPRPSLPPCPIQSNFFFGGGNLRVAARGKTEGCWKNTTRGGEKKKNKPSWNLWAAAPGCIFLRSDTVTESALQYSHVRKQIKKGEGRKMLQAKCFYGLKNENKKKQQQGFGFIAKCGGEEQRGAERRPRRPRRRRKRRRRRSL